MIRRLPSGRKLILLYLLLLAASHLCKPLRSPTGPLADGQQRAELGGIEFAYRDIPADRDGAPVVVLLHSTPWSPSTWDSLIPELCGKFRLIVPDLPGFGASTTEVDGYSTKTQAARVAQLLDHLGVDQVHLVGDGLGGSIALEIYAATAPRVGSLTLISTRGVQELELLGDYTLNHAVHGAQLFYAWLFYEGTPNFGLLDRAPYNLSYARSYYETDQRPLRDILLTVDVPTLIIHGGRNLLVPLAAAKEHARLVPHSQTEFLPAAGRKLLTQHAGEIAPPLITFVDRSAETGGPTRSDSTPERAEVSTAPFDYHSYEADLRRRVLFIVILLAIATLVSEDITCITAGLLVSQGAIGFVPATLGCLIGIFIGDTGLYLIGRVLGVRALRIPPLKWFVDAQKIERSKKFFDRYGPFLIVVTRWLPGTRIPTYVAGGMLKLNFFKFLIYFLCAAIIWTPALVGISTFIGERLLGWLHRFEQHALLVLVLTITAVLFLVHLALALATHRGRQLLKAKWYRRFHWQYWPTWLTDLPLLPNLIFLTLKHRRLPDLSVEESKLPPPSVTGDGERTLEFLILDTPETRHYANVLLGRHTDTLEDILGEGAHIQFPEVQMVDTSLSYRQYLSTRKSRWRQSLADRS
ncbi:MAG: alpha/beta fold hydrolase [Verrucomicrobiales bacterium]